VRGWTVEGKKMILCRVCAEAMRQLIRREQKTVSGIDYGIEEAEA